MCSMLRLVKVRKALFSALRVRTRIAGSWWLTNPMEVWNLEDWLVVCKLFVFGWRTFYLSLGRLISLRSHQVQLHLPRKLHWDLGPCNLTFFSLHPFPPPPKKKTEHWNTVDGSEISNNHLGCIKTFENWDIYYCNWCRISEPSTVPINAWNSFGPVPEACEKIGPMWVVTWELRFPLVKTPWKFKGSKNETKETGC